MSLASSFFWAWAVIHFRRARDTKTSLVVNLGKNIVGIISFSLAILIAGVSYFQPVSAKQLLLLTASGILGVAIGDLLFMASLYLLGAGMNSIVGCVYTPILISGSILFLGEKLTPGLIAGSVLVTVAIYLASVTDFRSRPKNLYLGIVIGILSMAATASSVIIMKPLLTAGSLVWNFQVNLIRLLTGSIVLIIWFLIKPSRHVDFSSLKNREGWKNIITGGLTGSFLAVLFWTLSLSSLPASVIAVLGQLTVIVIIFFARIFLGEAITKLKIAASFLAISGALAASFF